jgi:H+/Cl- antiporter ClcA
MTYRGRQTINFGKLLIAIGVGVIVALAVVFFAIAAAMGDCALNEDGSGCEYDGLVRFLMFPGSLLVAFVVMFVLIKWVTKTKDDVLQDPDR